jgi:hypothetical protein
MATLAREWAAVQRVELSAFRELLLSGKVGAGIKPLALEVPPRLQKHLESMFNESQLEALMAGLDGNPFVLIQGPPGTGKTQCEPPPPAASNRKSISITIITYCSSVCIRCHMAPEAYFGS